MFVYFLFGMQSNSNGAAAVPPPAAAPAALAAAQAAGTTVEELRGTTTPFSAMEKSVAKNMQASLAVAEFRATVRTFFSSDHSCRCFRVVLRDCRLVQGIKFSATISCLGVE